MLKRRERGRPLARLRPLRPSASVGCYRAAGWGGTAPACPAHPHLTLSPGGVTPSESFRVIFHCSARSLRLGQQQTAAGYCCGHFYESAPKVSPHRAKSSNGSARKVAHLTRCTFGVLTGPVRNGLRSNFEEREFQTNDDDSMYHLVRREDNKKIIVK